MNRRSAAVRKPPRAIDPTALAAELAAVRADRDALLVVLTHIASADIGFTRSLCRALAQVAVAGAHYPTADGYVIAACRHLEAHR